VSTPLLARGGPTRRLAGRRARPDARRVGSRAGDGTFADPVASDTGFPVNELRCADFDGDGATDLLAREVDIVLGPHRAYLGQADGTPVPGAVLDVSLLAETKAPFAGGTLVPLPVARLAMVAGDTGCVTVGGAWPADGGGARVGLQAWVDEGGVLAATSGVLLTAP